MNLLYYIILFSLALACSQDKIEYLNSGDLKIVQSKTGKTILVSSSCFNAYEFISEIGKPSSRIVEDNEAAGGKILILYYDSNYFYFAKENNSNNGFRIVNDNFHILIKNEFKIEVGESAEYLITKFGENRHYTDVYVGESRFKIPKINRITIPYLVMDKNTESNTIFSVVYNPDNYKILEISQSNRN